MMPFTYQRPGSLAEALKALKADPDAMAVAGGMTLVPAMKHRLAAPSQLFDIGGLTDLQQVRSVDGEIEIGAAVTHAKVAANSLVIERIPALASLASRIGDPQVRARGTLGGSVANNDPAADYPSAVLALDAVVVTNAREIAASDFFQGMFTTALEPGELIASIRFKIPKHAAYAKFHHPASGYAMTGVFVARLDDGVRVAVTGAGSSVFRWADAEAKLNEDFSAAALEGLTHSADGLNADMHAPAEYRANLIAVMAKRAVEQCENS
ncbi:MAG: xanthine dehydrogenase family protein subunit M [Burkholderiaceae bacterium]